MLSVVVAVHNQIGHNQLFLQGIRKYTTGPYEVVVIDNHSTDGSAEFLESQGCRVIRNAKNLCYPESMNLGTRNSTGDYVCHINNDLYVGPNWNGRLIEAMERFQLDAITPLGAGNDADSGIDGLDASALGHDRAGPPLVGQNRRTTSGQDSRNVW